MKSFWKIVRRLIHQLALSIGYLIIVAALLLAALFAIIGIAVHLKPCFGAALFKAWVDGPFGTSKFVLRRDPLAPAPLYFAVSTKVTD